MAGEHLPHKKLGIRRSEIAWQTNQSIHGPNHGIRIVRA